MSAIRLARAATGRTKVLKFAGAYHGHVDGLLAEAGSGLATAGIPASPGVPESATHETVIVPFNDGEAVAKAFAEHEFAAVIAEPYPANMGLVPPVEGFLELLRHKADDNGALLIFDEVITGFRVAAGGAQEREGIAADLDGHGQDHRRRPAGCGLRRLARADGPHRAGRRRLPGRNAQRQPAGRRRRPGDAADARRRGLHPPQRHDRDAGRRPARRGGRRRGPGRGELGARAC